MRHGHPTVRKKQLRYVRIFVMFLLGQGYPLFHIASEFCSCLCKV